MDTALLFVVQELLADLEVNRSVSDPRISGLTDALGRATDPKCDSASRFAFGGGQFADLSGFYRRNEAFVFTHAGGKSAGLARRSRCLAFRYNAELCQCAGPPMG